jgi:hypothetical protein
MKSIRQQSSRRVALSAAAGISLVLALSVVFLPPVTVMGAEVPDVSGTWEWTSLTPVVVPGDVGPAFWGVNPEGAILHLTCRTWGTLTIVQNGSSFTGTSDQSAECITKGGQTAAWTPFGPFYTVSGSIMGHNVTIQGEDFCAWQGSLSVQKGVATAFHTVGGCQPPGPLPVHPLKIWDINFDGVREQ